MFRLKFGTISDAYRMDNHRPIEDKVLEFLSTLQDNHEVGDQRWIRTLLDHGVNNTISEIVELGAMI